MAGGGPIFLIITILSFISSQIGDVSFVSNFLITHHINRAVSHAVGYLLEEDGETFGEIFFFSSLITGFVIGTVASFRSILILALPLVSPKDGHGVVGYLVGFLFGRIIRYFIMVVRNGGDFTSAFFVMWRTRGASIQTSSAEGEVEPRVSLQLLMFERFIYLSLLVFFLAITLTGGWITSTSMFLFNRFYFYVYGYEGRPDWFMPTHGVIIQLELVVGRYFAIVTEGSYFEEPMLFIIRALRFDLSGDFLSVSTVLNEMQMNPGSPFLDFGWLPILRFVRKLLFIGVFPISMSVPTLDLMSGWRCGRIAARDYFEELLKQYAPQALNTSSEAPSKINLVALSSWCHTAGYMVAFYSSVSWHHTAVQTALAVARHDTNAKSANMAQHLERLVKVKLADILEDTSGNIGYIHWCFCYVCAPISTIATYQFLKHYPNFFIDAVEIVRILLMLSINVDSLLVQYGIPLLIVLLHLNKSHIKYAVIAFVRPVSSVFTTIIHTSCHYQPDFIISSFDSNLLARFKIRASQILSGKDEVLCHTVLSSVVHGAFEVKEEAISRHHCFSTPPYTILRRCVYSFLADEVNHFVCISGKRTFLQMERTFVDRLNHLSPGNDTCPETILVSRESLTNINFTDIVENMKGLDCLVLLCDPCVDSFLTQKLAKDFESQRCFVPLSFGLSSKLVVFVYTGKMSQPSDTGGPHSNNMISIALYHDDMTKRIVESEGEYYDHIRHIENVIGSS
jgi:hypothetical protein